MRDKMTFPETWEEFEKSYGFDDSEEIYTNGSRLIPSFRVKQWLDHEESKRETKQQATVSSDLISRQETVKAITSYNGVVDKSVAKRLLLQMPSAEPEIIHCKDCRNRGEDECPMRHVERRERNE